ncbi:MAG: hypothetical protein L3J67_04125 [Hyphomicrobiaceae bacterium]|nr:hypothetical protein [Hyphomicrobiaceae bacterium]
MLTYALIAFAVTALIGLVMAASVLRGALAPWALSLVHAALGATGLVLLLVAVLNGTAELIPIALGTLVVAALGGFYLAFLHLQNKPAPSSIVLIHASVAVIGVLMLTGTVLGLL